MKWKSIPFWVIGAAVFVVVIGVCVFFAYTLSLWTEYKETALRINDTILAYQEQSAIRYKEKEAAADSQLLDYYDSFLLAPKTVVYSRKDAETDENTITIVMGKSELSFSGMEDGSAILIHWKTPDEAACYRVRSNTTFMQLKAYCENYLRKVG